MLEVLNIPMACGIMAVAMILIGEFFASKREREEQEGFHDHDSFED